MEQIEKKTTLLLTQDLYKRLLKLSRMTKKSMGQLLREAAERQYFSAPVPEKREIVRKMASMNIPVGTPEEIEAEILRGALDSPES